MENLTPDQVGMRNRLAELMIEASQNLGGEFALADMLVEFCAGGWGDWNEGAEETVREHVAALRQSTQQETKDGTWLKHLKGGA